jgi:ferredoxin--NADP+ reductase
MLCRVVLVSIGLGAQAYAPLQMMAHGSKGLAILPENPGNVRGSLSPQKLVISSATEQLSPSRIPYFSAKPDQTISWDDNDWCLEAEGNQRGSSVRVNQCTGEATQKWNWIPNGQGSNMLQLKDTMMCLDVRDGHGLNGAPIELRDCQNSVTETWKFEDVMPLPGSSERPASGNVFTYLLSLAAVGALSVGAWIWRGQYKMAAARSLDSDGVALTAPVAASRSGDVSMAAGMWGWNPAWKQEGIYETKPNPFNPPAATTTAATATVETPAVQESSTEQNFLEYEPYTDYSKMPMNTAKNKDPFIGKVISVDKIVAPNATGETYDIVIDHYGKLPFIEGQSFGVIPPGVDAKGKPNKVRLYSIAASRYGDDMKGTNTTLCVRRATYWDPDLGAEDPAKKGVCSNYLCDAKPGDEVKLTGPTGKVLLLPESNPSTDIIMVATGTGIAPYRSFLRRMFVEKTPYGRDFKGLAWLFLGVANTDSLLYDEDWKKIQKENPDRFRYDVALSREQQNKSGGKMYIQDKVEEYADEIFDRLDKGAHMYFCGLRGMMPGIQDMLKKVCESKGLDFDEFIKDLKSKGQWHVEVY